MADDGIQPGQIYSNVKRPRRAWQVTGRIGDRFRLERIDDGNVVRYPDLKALRDRTRYLPDTEEETIGLVGKAVAPPA
jgi:hypothetical protein